MLLEQDVRDEFRKRWTGWFETYQPGRGGGVGVPDTQIMAHPPLLVPIELKRGQISAGRLFADDLRPAQVSWNTRFTLAGGKSYFIIGIGEPKAIAFYIAPSQIVIDRRSTGIVLSERTLSVLPTSDVKAADAHFTNALRRYLAAK